jgi:hypothetical protein
MVMTGRSVMCVDVVVVYRSHAPWHVLPIRSRPDPPPSESLYTPNYMYNTHTTLVYPERSQHHLHMYLSQTSALTLLITYDSRKSMAERHPASKKRRIMTDLAALSYDPAPANNETVDAIKLS